MSPRFSIVLPTVIAVVAAFLIAGCSGDDDSVTSPPLLKWVQRDSGTTRTLKDVEWNGEKFIAVGWDVILSSTDGINWSPEQLPLEWEEIEGSPLESVCWSDSLQLFLAAGGDQGILTSPDGVTWTLQYPGLSFGFVASAVAFDTLLLVSLHNPVALLYSYDGVIWTKIDGTGPFDAMAAHNGRVFGVGGQPGTSIFSSDDGFTWTSRHTGDSLLHCITWFDYGSRWIAAGHLGYFLSSATGLSWTGVSAGAGDLSTLFDAVANDERCVVVGSANGAGLIMTSSNGSDWTKQVIDSVGWLNGVAASPDRFVIVGELGVILTSF